VLSEFKGYWKLVEAASREYDKWDQARESTDFDVDKLHEVEETFFQLQYGAGGHPLMAWYWDESESHPEPPGDLPYEDAIFSDGLPIPLARLGTVTPIPWTVVQDPDIDRAQNLTLESASVLGDYRSTLPERLAEIEPWAAQASNRASETLRLMLLDAPTIRLRVGVALDWIHGRPLRWVTPQSRYPQDIELSALSTAERKWAAFAILHTQLAQSNKLVWIMDEPEAALHRSAEEHMARGLTKCSEKLGYWVVATHSPALLDDPHTHVSRVHKQDFISRVAPLSSADMLSLEHLGLEPSDLLRRWQVVLLVEGHQEELIFDAAVGARLRAARIHVLPFGGVRQLHSVIDSRLLWDFTDAALFPVVDNEKAARLDQVWEQAIWLDAAEGTEAAIDHIDDNLRKKHGFETQAMQEFLKLAIAKGRPTYSRIRPFAFSKPDITDYLPLEVLLPEYPKKTWAKLRKEHASQSGQQPLSFKDWMEKAYGKQLGRTIFTDQAIREAARAMDVPEEFEMLLRRCENAGPPIEDEGTSD
jgi:hypothetical protein